MAKNRDEPSEVARPMDPAAQFLAALSKSIPRLAGTPITGDAVDFHDGTKISLPKGMTFERALDVLTQLREDAETPTSFDRTFRYRADDGAYATYMTIKDRYGMMMGKQTKSFFGTQPAETRTIAIDVGKTMQLPWGRLSIPVFEGLEVSLGETMDRDYGRIFVIHANGPKKYKHEVEEFFDAVENFLKTKSIYRGKAIIGSNNPEFLDLQKFDASKIVFSDAVTATLEGTLWAPLRYTPAMRANNIPLKRALLAYGPYGTGKTSLGQMTAEIAVANEWTFISAKPGRDNVEDVLRTARLYQPSVVFIEDIDTQAAVSDADDVSKLLDAFDGITAKGGELIVLMTTNHPQHIHKGMLRPGRLDAVIEIAGLDGHGVERLIKAVIPAEKLATDIDYEQVSAAMDGFLPAFVREALTRAVTFAIDRLKGDTNYIIDTPDLVYAAQSLVPQLDMLNGANEGERKPEIETALSGLVREAVLGLQARESMDPSAYALVMAEPVKQD